jgi:hypothetical protein
MLIEDPDCGLGKLDGDCLDSMAEADLAALARDLDATGAGDPPLDGQIAFWQRVGSSEADAPVPLAGRIGQGRVRHRMPSWVMTCMTWPSRRQGRQASAGPAEDRQAGHGLAG